MEDKLEWTLEKEQEETVKTDKEEKEKIDREALADYVISVMPPEFVQALKEGKTPQQAVQASENERLKKENEELKRKLALTQHKPLELTGTGGEREKDPFAIGFMQAMENY